MRGVKIPGLLLMTLLLLASAYGDHSNAIYAKQEREDHKIETELLQEFVIGRWIPEYGETILGEPTSSLEFRQDETLVSTMRTMGRWKLEDSNHLLLYHDERFFPEASVSEKYKVEKDTLRDEFNHVLTKADDAVLLTRTTKRKLWSKYVVTASEGEREIELKGDGSFVSTIKLFEKRKLWGNSIKVYNQYGRESPWVYRVMGGRIEVGLRDNPQICFTPYVKEGRKVAMNERLQRNLNVFFSKFAEARLQPFVFGQIDNKELIEFGILYCWFNDDKLFEYVGDKFLAEEEEPRFDVRIKATYVEAVVKKYFGRKPEKHESTNGYVYKGGYYYMHGADGAILPFAHVVEFYDLGNDFYRAIVDIYKPPDSTWTDYCDPYGTPEDWLKCYPWEFPEHAGRMHALLKYLPEEKRFILVEWFKVK